MQVTPGAVRPGTLVRLRVVVARARNAAKEKRDPDWLGRKAVIRYFEGTDVVVEWVGSKDLERVPSADLVLC